MADTYAQLRRRWKPEPISLLLAGESAPDPGAAELRFFYAPTLTAHDNLFRGVILALYGQSPGHAGDSKRPWLEALHGDGVYLIDLVPFPVNALSARERKQALRDHAANCVAEAAACEPQAIAVCHGPTFNALRGPASRRRAASRVVSPVPQPMSSTSSPGLIPHAARTW